MIESLSLSQKRHLALNELYHLSLQLKEEIKVFTRKISYLTLEILESGCTLIRRGITQTDLSDLKHQIESLKCCIQSQLPNLSEFLDKESTLFLEGILLNFI